MMKIGEKIKELRKQKNITQEKLAAYLNISYQAVSKWENGTALPDITFIPMIAGFFEISADELLGIKNGKNNPELKEYDELYQKYNREGKVSEKIELSRNVLKKYPKNYQWMLNLAYGLIAYCSTAEQEKYSKEHGFIQEAITICERILEDCSTDSIRQSAIQILCCNYPAVGKAEEAFKLANQMPDMLLSRETLLSHIYTGEKRIKQLQENLLSMIDMCAGILYELSNSENLNLSADEKIKYLEAAATLYKTVLENDENSLFYNCRLCLYYEKLAELYCQNNNSDNAVKYLRLAEKCAYNYDNCMVSGEQKYNSIFADRCTFNPKTVGTNMEGTLKEWLSKCMNKKVFSILPDSVKSQFLH